LDPGPWTLTRKRPRVEKKEKEAERKKNASLRILSFPHIKEKCRGTNEPLQRGSGWFDSF
jgi:hypothetical protein